MIVLFLMSLFRLYPGLNMSFQHKTVRKKNFLSACRCCNERLSLSEMDQKFEFNGIFGCGDSYLEYLFRNFNIVTQHAMLHDAAGAVRAHSGKDPGYCYMIGREPNSYSLKIKFAGSRDWTTFASS